tara:strand:+ start:101 stop:388 length:288 start_codon:yes stop_codon:yes gene_type:complete
MKKLVLGFLVLIVASLCLSFVNSNRNTETKTELVSQNSYEKGWEEGYCEGWKDVKGQMALCPLTPLCPLPELDCPEGYKCGYNRGFKAGMKAAKK